MVREKKTGLTLQTCAFYKSFNCQSAVFYKYYNNEEHKETLVRNLTFNWLFKRFCYFPWQVKYQNRKKKARKTSDTCISQ